MNLSKLTPAVLGILLTALPFHAAFAQKRGGTDGGGGGAIVHTDKSGNVFSSELLDLWEARNLPHKWENDVPYILTIPYSDAPVLKQIAGAMAKLKRIDPIFAERVADDLEFVQNKSNWNILKKNISITPPADAQNIYFETGSDLKGMMYFDGELNKLSIKPEIFDKSINNTSIAASFTHEAIYKALRDMDILGSSNSTPVRKINACLYATNDCFGLTLVRPPQPGSAVYNCVSQDQQSSSTLVLSPFKPSRDDFQVSAEMKLSRLGSVKYPIPLTARFNLYTAATVLQGSYLHITNQLANLYLQMSMGKKLPPYIPNFAGTDVNYDPLVGRNMEDISVRGTRNEDSSQLTITLPESYVVSSESTVPAQTFNCTRAN